MSISPSSQRQLRSSTAKPCDLRYFAASSSPYCPTAFLVRIDDHLRRRTCRDQASISHLTFQLWTTPLPTPNYSKSLAAHVFAARRLGLLLGWRADGA